MVNYTPSADVVHQLSDHQLPWMSIACPSQGNYASANLIWNTFFVLLPVERISSSHIVLSNYDDRLRLKNRPRGLKNICPEYLS